jgi:hypothetical protein
MAIVVSATSSPIGLDNAITSMTWQQHRGMAKSPRQQHHIMTNATLAAPSSA